MKGIGLTDVVASVPFCQVTISFLRAHIFAIAVAVKNRTSGVPMPHDVNRDARTMRRFHHDNTLQKKEETVTNRPADNTNSAQRQCGDYLGKRIL